MSLSNFKPISHHRVKKQLESMLEYKTGESINITCVDDFIEIDNMYVKLINCLLKEKQFYFLISKNHFSLLLDNLEFHQLLKEEKKIGFVITDSFKINQINPSGLLSKIKISNEFVMNYLYKELEDLLLVDNISELTNHNYSIHESGLIHKNGIIYSILK